MLINKKGKAVKLSHGMQITLKPRDSTIRIDDENGDRLLWGSGMSDKKFCQLKNQTDFMSVVEMIADTNGLCATLVSGSNNVVTTYKFSKQA